MVQISTRNWLVFLCAVLGSNAVMIVSRPEDLDIEAGMAPDSSHQLVDDEGIPKVGLISVGQLCVFHGTICREPGRLIVERRSSFLVGSDEILGRFASGYQDMETRDRILLSSTCGIGYPLTGPAIIGVPPTNPALKGQQIQFPIETAVARSKYSYQLVAFTADGDLPPGGPKLIGGKDAAFQAFVEHMRLGLGEWKFDPDLGSRCAEYLRTYSGQALAEDMLTLEAIRIAYAGKDCATFVSKIRRVQLVDENGRDVRLNLIVDLEGYGTHHGSIILRVGDPSPEAERGLDKGLVELGEIEFM
jgi:hypothetical protein